jgi:hypothetical protein
MRCGDVLNPIEYGDFLIGECDGLMQRYDDWNAEVRGLHDRNSHLYLQEIRVREAHSESKCRRRKRTHLRVARRRSLGT